MRPSILIALFILTIGLLSAAAFARGSSKPQSAGDQRVKAAGTTKHDATLATGSMKFSIQYNGGNCKACEWVMAEGEIDAGTTERLKKFVETNNPPYNIRFNSPGGNIIEALKFGYYLRDSKWDTFVNEDDPRIPDTYDGYKTQESNCYSACVYAFAGGVHRTAAEKAVGIHQFYRPDDAARPNDKTISAVDVANMQRLAALLNEYVRRMGVDPRLVTIASGITPWDPIYLLSSAELKSLNLDNTSPVDTGASADWHVQPTADGAMAITTQSQDGAGRAASLRIMCFQANPHTIVVELSVTDETRDWAAAFKAGLSPQNFAFDLDGKYESLNATRLVGPVRLSKGGVTLALVISEDELGRMLKAKSLDIAGFVHMASLRWVGELGGTFSMAGAPSVVRLALKNCIPDAPE